MSTPPSAAAQFRLLATGRESRTRGERSTRAEGHGRLTKGLCELLGVGSLADAKDDDDDVNDDDDDVQAPQS